MKQQKHTPRRLSAHTNLFSNRSRWIWFIPIILIFFTFPVSAQLFIRGDVNGDGDTNFWVGDATFLANAIVNNCPFPCDSAADADDSGMIDMLGDIGAIIAQNFTNPSTIPAPFPTCGTDPTTDSLPCNIACPSFSGHTLHPDFKLKMIPPISGGGFVGDIIEVEIELEVPVSHEVLGFSFGISHDPSMLGFIDLQPVQFSSAEIVSVDPHLNGVGSNLHFLMDIKPPLDENYLQPGNYTVATARYTILAPGSTDLLFNAPPGNSSPGSLALSTREISYPCNVEVFAPAEYGCTLNNLSPTQGNSFIRGDTNGDGDIDFWIGDATFLFNSIVNSCPLPCESAADTNDDGLPDMGDLGPIIGENSSWSSAPGISLPYPICGTDPTYDTLPCNNPCPTFSGYLQNPSFQLTLNPLSGGGGTIGDIIEVEVVLEIPTSQEVLGFSVGVCHDPAMLQLIDLYVPAFLPADLVMGDPHPFGSNLHVMMNATGPWDENYLQPGSHTIGIARYQVLAPGLTDINFCSVAGNHSPGVIALSTREIANPCNFEVITPDASGCTLSNTAPLTTHFVRGDTNASGGNPDIADAINVLNYVIGLPAGISPCDDASDVNDDGLLDLGDGIFLLLEYLFPTDSTPIPPPTPFAACGSDPTADSLDCLSFPPCP